MHRRLLSAAAALAAFAATTPALAQSSLGSVDVQGTVAERCQFTSASTVLLDIGEMSVTSGAASDLGKYDPTVLEGRSATLNGWCNGSAAVMTVQATPMTHQTFAGTPPSGFERRVDFTATATVGGGGGAASDSTLAAGPGSPAAVGLFSNDVTVSFSNSGTPGGGRLVAGAYDGTVEVTLAPSS
jgi:hypothetical protein